MPHSTTVSLLKKLHFCLRAWRRGCNFKGGRAGFATRPHLKLHPRRNTRKQKCNFLSKLNVVGCGMCAAIL